MYYLHIRLFIPSHSGGWICDHITQCNPVVTITASCEVFQINKTWLKYMKPLAVLVHWNKLMIIASPIDHSIRYLMFLNYIFSTWNLSLNCWAIFFGPSAYKVSLGSTRYRRSTWLSPDDSIRHSKLHSPTNGYHDMSKQHNKMQPPAKCLIWYKQKTFQDVFSFKKLLWYEEMIFQAAFIFKWLQL